MDWTDYEFKREQHNDFVRDAERERLARQLPRRQIRFALPCWLESRLDFARALLRHAWRQLVTAGNVSAARPVLSDCEG